MKLYIALVSLITLISCGTANGVLRGTSEVLEGMSRDVRGASTVFE